MMVGKLSAVCLLMTPLLLPETGAAAEDPLSHSLHWAILFLLAMPYAIGGSIIAWIAYTKRRGNCGQDGRRKKSGELLPATKRSAREHGIVPPGHPTREGRRGRRSLSTLRGLHLIERPKEGGR